MVENTTVATEEEEVEFGFYGDDNDELGQMEKKGITGNVTEYTYTNMQFPCIIFNKDFACPKHKMNVIKNMVDSAVGSKDISLYFLNEKDLFKIGMIDGLQLNFFLEVVGTDNVTGFYDSETKLTGSLLYTLSAVG